MVLHNQFQCHPTLDKKPPPQHPPQLPPQPPPQPPLPPPPGRAGFVTVRVKIADDDDNKPLFKMKEYKAQINADAPFDAQIVKVGKGLRGMLFRTLIEL